MAGSTSVEWQNKILMEFDPLHPAFAEAPSNPLMVELYDVSEGGQDGQWWTIKWHFPWDLQQSLVRIMNKIQHTVRTRHKLKYFHTY